MAHALRWWCLDIPNNPEKFVTELETCKKKQQHKNISLVTKNDEKTVPYEMYYFFPPTDLKIQFFATANWSGRY